MKYYRTGVHTLVDLLYSPQKFLSNKKYDKSFSDMGNVIHLKLGYVGGETFKKYYVYE